MASPSPLTTRDTTSATESAQWQFLSLPSDSVEATPIKRYIQSQFARCHGARIDEFLPLQLAILHGGAIKAAAGLRIGDSVSLFIEQYLDHPCDQEIATHFHVIPPARRSIAEVGNLAASNPQAVRQLFIHIAAVARAHSLEWLICNATQRVQAILQYMHLPFSAIRAADPARISNVERWGTYYDRPSHVMAAPLDGIIEAMMRTAPLHLALAESRARATAQAPSNRNDAGARP